MRRDIERYNRPRAEVEHLIQQWIFSERNRNILTDWLLNGLTFEKIAEKYDMSDRQIKNITHKALNVLEKHF